MPHSAVELESSVVYPGLACCTIPCIRSQHRSGQASQTSSLRSAQSVPPSPPFCRSVCLKFAADHTCIINVQQGDAKHVFGAGCSSCSFKRHNIVCVCNALGTLFSEPRLIVR